jgi:hypothetical protein
VIAHPELPFLALVMLAGSFGLAAMAIEIKRRAWRIACRWFSECLDGAAVEIP